MCVVVCQAECCVLLSKLACDERSCRLLLECGLCETLCGSMAALWNDVMVQARGMQAMANLAGETICQPTHQPPTTSHGRAEDRN
jgi:hypothetical protein